MDATEMECGAIGTLWIAILQFERKFSATKKRLKRLKSSHGLIKSQKSLLSHFTLFFFVYLVNWRKGWNVMLFYYNIFFEQRVKESYWIPDVMLRHLAMTFHIAFNWSFSLRCKAWVEIRELDIFVVVKAQNCFWKWGVHEVLIYVIFRCNCWFLRRKKLNFIKNLAFELNFDFITKNMSKKSYTTQELQLKSDFFTIRVRIRTL